METEASCNNCKKKDSCTRSIRLMASDNELKHIVCVEWATVLMSKNKKQLEKLKKFYEENSEDLFEALKKIGMKSECCNAELEQDKWGSIYCKKCKKMIIGKLQEEKSKAYPEDAEDSYNIYADEDDEI